MQPSLSESLFDQQRQQAQLLDSLAHMRQATQNALHEKDIAIERLQQQYEELLNHNFSKSSLKEIVVDTHLSEVDTLQKHVENLQEDHGSIIEEKDLLLAKIEKKRGLIRSMVKELEAAIALKESRLEQMEAVRQRKTMELRKRKNELEQLQLELSRYNSSPFSKRSGNPIKDTPKQETAKTETTRTNSKEHDTKRLYRLESFRHKQRLKELVEHYEHQLSQVRTNPTPATLGYLVQNRSSIRYRLTGTSEQSTVFSNDPLQSLSLRQQLSSCLEHDEILDPDLFTVRSADVNHERHLQLKPYRASSNYQNTLETFAHDQEQSQRAKTYLPATEKEATQNNPNISRFSSQIVVAAVLSLLFAGFLWAKK